MSPGHPTKDYAIAPAKYALSGTRELWIFDPMLAGPAAHGGPCRLQIWTRDPAGALVRSYAGEGPAESPVLGAWLVATQDGARLRIASDRDGRQLWPTAEEAAIAERDTARARIAELEAALRARG